MGRLLADQLSDLANKPAVEDYDVEDVFEHNDKDSSDESGSEVDEKLEKAHYAPVEKSRLRKDGIELGEKYQGAKGSRKDAFEEEEEAGEEEEEDGMSDAKESESDAMSFKTDSEDEQGEGNEESADEEEEEEEESAEEAEPQEDEQRQRLAALVQAERRKAVNNLSESTKRDASKGSAILEQSKLFDNIIEVRMKLQKAVTDVNRLPVTQESLEKNGSSNTGKLLKHAAKLLNKVMGEIVDFREEFQKGDQISEDSSSEMGTNQRKRNFGELVKETDELDDQLRPYRSTVLHRWSTKISAASGGSALNSTKFKAINQPANVQVENQLADLPRLVKRTRLSRKGVQPIHFEQDLAEGRLANDLNSEQSQEGQDVQQPDIPKNYDPRRKTTIDQQENAYIFDDEDFYRILLNDLVDKKINNARIQGTGAQIAITTRSNKLKKDVDTKASKGRKLNYSIQDPIAHYETTRTSVNQWSDEQIDEFFAGLLGQKVNFDEDADAQKEPEEDDDIKNDDIQIFG